MRVGILPRGRRAWIRAGLFLGVPILAAVAAWWWTIRMPGRSHAGPLPAITASQSVLRDRLRTRVVHLAEGIGPRGLHAPGTLEKSAAWIDAEFRAAGLQPARHEYRAGGSVVANVEAAVAGSSRPREILVVGAHYDSDAGCPGANDNATGVASLLEIAASMRKRIPARSVRFVAFTNEEPPWFRQEGMGSLAYARRCRERGEEVVGMISLETMGCYSDEPGSQKYPFPFGLFYPSEGNFICFVGNSDSRTLVRASVASFRRHARFPSEGAAPSGRIPGIGLSDHWSFWQAGYPALMATDTAFFRYEYYHSSGDTPDKVDFERLARVTEALVEVVADLASPK